MKQNPRSKRRVQLIKPRLQLRITLAFMGLTVFMLLFQALWIVSYLTEVASKLPSEGSYLMDLIPGLLTKVTLTSLGIILPLTLAIGILATFRVAGPIYRFEQYLKSVIRRESTGPCRIREGDALQELCKLINGALEVARETPLEDSETDEPLRRAG